jgi:hypothetical protein
MTTERLDGYLWDRSGEPDDQLRELETMLSQFRHARPLSPIDDELAVNPDLRDRGPDD